MDNDLLVQSPLLNKYVVAEEMERCGRADIALIILYDDDSLWATNIYVDVDAQGNPTREGYDCIIKAMENNRERVSRCTWNDRFNLAIDDYKHYVQCKLDNQEHRDSADEIVLEYVFDIGSPHCEHGDENWTSYLWYPRYVMNTPGQDKILHLNPIMLRNTERRCQHEFDCCGQIYCNAMCIEYYDWIRDGWLLTQGFYRNI